MPRRGCRLAQVLAVLSGVGQTGPHPFAQNIATTASNAAITRPAGVVC